MTAPDISVVIPAHNAEATLAAVLEGLIAAGFAATSIHVVDDGSTDATASIARHYHVTCHSNASAHGAAAARNRGVQETTGDVILFVDADVVVHQDVRNRLLNWAATYPDTAAMFGSYDDHPADRHRISRIRNVLHHHTHQVAPTTATTFWTGLGAVRRTAFDAVGGFDPEQSYMEDIAFGHALCTNGYAIQLDPAFQGTHLKRWTLIGFLRTDLLHRAIPWSRLIKRADAPRTLNAGKRGMASVALVGTSLIGGALMPFAPITSLIVIIACMLALAALNIGFLKCLHRLDGPNEAIAGLCILWLHYLMAGLGFTWVTLRG